MRSLLIAALLFAISIRAQDLRPYELPAEIGTQVRALTAAEPLRLLAGIASMNLQLRSAAEGKWDELDPRAQCALVRAGLRSGDPEIAIGAAVKAGKGWWLDVAETKRAAAVGMARCNVENTPFSVADFFGLLDAEDAARFLASPGPHPREVPQFLGSLHQRFGPEHWAQVELLAYGDDWLLRQDATHFLNFLKCQRLRYAHFLLSRPVVEPELPDDFDPLTDRLPYEPRKFRLRPKGPGYHPVLAALLEHVFLSGRRVEGREMTFTWRWAREQVAAEIDRALLLRLAASEHEAARRVAVRGLERLGGEDATAALRRCSDGDFDHLSPCQALGALARAGDAEARDRLEQLSPTHTLALAMLWQVDRKRASKFIDVAFGKVGGTRLAHLLEATVDGAFWGLPMDGVAAVMVARAADSTVSGATLGLLLDELPAARTQALLRRATASLTAENVEQMPLSVLELGNVEALAERLHAILRAVDLSDDALLRTMRALTSLPPPLLGDDDRVMTLYQRCGDIRSDESCARMRVRIAAARGDAVRELALTRLDEPLDSRSWESAGTLAIAVASCGVDFRTASGLLYNLARNTELAELVAVRDAMVASLRTGNGAEAIGTALEIEGFGLGHVEVWRLPDAIALPILRRSLEQRELRQYREAIGQLMRRGDPEARAVIESVIRRRLYGWIDSVGRLVLSDGKSLERVPLLLSQVDSNCCTYAVIATALEDVFEVDAFVGESGVQSRVALLHATWARHRENLRWSRIADRWLIVPE